MMHRRGVVVQHEQDNQNRPVSSVASASADTSKQRRPRKRRFYHQYPILIDIAMVVTTLVFIYFVGTVLLVTCRFLLGGSGRGSSASVRRQHQDDALRNLGRRLHQRRWYADRDDILEWNPIYRVKESMEIVGDRGDDYAKLRQEIDPVLPDDAQRSFRRVEELKTHTYTSYDMDGHDDQERVLDPTREQQQATYDIYNCPDTPPRGYPFAWNMMLILDNWPADDTTPRSNIYQGLCVFDYDKDYEKAMTYRDAELPFVVVNDPAVAKTVERWNVPGYMHNLLGRTQHRTEVSENNHFMYYQPPSKKRKRRAANVPEDWVQPTQPTRMAYAEWLKHANVTAEEAGPDHPHWYFRLIGCGLLGNDGSCDRGSSEYLYDELPFFQPKESLYIVEPEEQKGIHCRFGMKGIIAENHFDAGRNAIVVLGGSRRYILAHPNQCNNLALYPKGHPSARHSEVDWSDPNTWSQFPQFAEARGNEVVMQPGQVMYLPNNWFHYIISLDLNFQCNTRSGVTDDYPLDFCGF